MSLKPERYISHKHKMWPGIILLSRPVNVLIAFASVFVAALLCDASPDWGAVFLACGSAGLVTAAANAINDYFDLDIDRINKPERPLPSGLISKKHAIMLAVLCYTGGILLGALINTFAFIIVITISFLLYLYSAVLKRTVLLGNAVVSLSTAFAFIYGGVAVRHPERAIIPAVFAFFMHFGREIIKDMEDVRGDNQLHAYTLPVLYGVRPAQWLVTYIFITLFVLTLLPFLLKIYGTYYFITVMMGVNSVLIGVIFMVWKNTSTKMLHRLSVLLKADMPVGLLAIYLGQW